MPESEAQIKEVQDLERNEGYIVRRTIFNTTILHPLPHAENIPPYYRDMGNLHLEAGDKLTYLGTAGDLKAYGDVVSDTPLFKPSEEIRKRVAEGYFVGSDVLAMNPLAVVNLDRQEKKIQVEESFISPIDLLRHVSSEFKRLGDEATVDLTEHKNTAACQEKLVRRAELIISLPDKVSDFVKKGVKFRDEDMNQLEVFAYLASERLESGDYFGLSTLLSHQGQKVGDPNELDKLVEEMIKKSHEVPSLSDLLKPGQTAVIVQPARIGGEPEEVEKVIQGNNRHKVLIAEYSQNSREDLEKEYRRINSDFKLRMKEEDKLQAILGVLVEKYNITSEDLNKLRE